MFWEGLSWRGELVNNGKSKKKKIVDCPLAAVRKLLCIAYVDEILSVS